MPKRHSHQHLPAAGPQREALRQKGQFWTPAWVAEAMATYVLAGGASSVFDPAVGQGAFFRAIKQVAGEAGRTVRLLGREIHPEAIEQARASGLTSSDLRRVEFRDFLLDPPPSVGAAVIANPPYLRHHRIPANTKARLQAFGRNVLGRPLDGRAGLHVYFLLQALVRLDAGGRLAFILPADTFEGIFARPLWDWITSHFCLDAVVTFAPDATPFPGVDTNAVVVMLRKDSPRKSFTWCLCNSDGDALKSWGNAGFPRRPNDGRLSAVTRSLAEALETGLSRPPQPVPHEGPRLGDYATVMRGIATGSNEFFFLSAEQVRQLELPRTFLSKAIGKTRDVRGDDFTAEDFRALAEAGKPCMLLSLGRQPMGTLPSAVRRYVEAGEREGLPKRALISQRKPWYKMESRAVPRFLFAYLGRRSARFIRNSAKVVPLTGFLCIYPRDVSEEFCERLWQVLSHPRTVANLRLVGKSYGSGAIKVEPRALESLPLPGDIVLEAGLALPDLPLQLAMI